MQRQQTQQSLQQRVNDILRRSPFAYGVEESRQESVETIFNMLQRTEAELKDVQDRVNRLKWELEKARS